MFRPTLVALCLLALPGAASSQQPAPCTWETARPVTVRTLNGAPTRWVGACVRVRADLDRRSLSTTRRERATVTERTSIGAYFADETLSDAASAWSRPRRVEALGVVGLCRNICADANARASAAAGASSGGVTTFTVCLPAGWCHYYDDPYVLIDAIR
jgi:hypothetical protein